MVLDEVQRLPAITETLRGVIDDNRRTGFRNGQFLLLGSASLDLMKLSSESLAGRISFLELSGVNVDEAASSGIGMDDRWVREGFLTPYWRQMTTPALAAGPDPVVPGTRYPDVRPRIPAETLRRLWTMLAHSSGGQLNASKLAAGLGVTSPTVTRYIDLLADLALVRSLPAWHTNVGKRVTKAPKVHVRDSGLPMLSWT